ncbi:hypothetical protein NC653_001612 [Populus alba x Populus x berolinensis]|uniref:Uncharacterized protein n=1 Tax=Populus alba x Populus x berolinensis TaxID=444605 RepID=A0AAD6RLX7_9ROSI|nr:hypothetical protein NC653_001612 [Populus alba x Populus x berolinensis]
MTLELMQKWTTKDGFSALYVKTKRSPMVILINTYKESMAEVDKDFPSLIGKSQKQARAPTFAAGGNLGAKLSAVTVVDVGMETFVSGGCS